MKKTREDERILQCPRCFIDMKKLKKDGVVVDVCKACGGMWLDVGEIDTLAEKYHGKK